jgi:hypothetical protein
MNMCNRPIEPNNWKMEEDRVLQMIILRTAAYPMDVSHNSTPIKSVTECKKYQTVEFEVHKALAMKISVFWDITQCSPLKVNWCLEGMCFLHLQGEE